MKILLFGSQGQIGRELYRSLSSIGELKPCDRKTVDFTNLDKLNNIVKDYSPEIIVNAAAYTSVDKAESEPEKSYLINAKAISCLAEKATKINALLIHYSTDYVFDGMKDHYYLETDKTNPLSVYGKSKLQGEDAIRSSGCNHLIFRTSWVYSVNRSNFVKNIIELAKKKNEIKVVSDQIGAPTSAELIANITAICLVKTMNKSNINESGLYHLTSKGETSWFNYAKFVIENMKNLGSKDLIDIKNIVPVSSSQFFSHAQRPANSRLDTKKIIDTFGVYLPPWQFHMLRVIKELYSKEL